jgi:AAA+ ATPase superfamily predicted ATPase
MVERALEPILLDLSRRYPVVTITGPRQSGKTTLCRKAFPKLKYANLEAPDVRRFATEDPRGFLAAYSGGEIQKCRRFSGLSGNVVGGIVCPAGSMSCNSILWGWGRVRCTD